ncbi:ABC transporter ATP-binding protein (plasmid) [Agrobacterium tumefaciens]|uniref:ABC transporter ATP-binding protein n=1 Tax=Agrobacterium tumefaciens TaxID=358 RepID=A0AAP9J9J5_AGRTU|nr:ABC transporter ATP-binding protein [Agrobacterium tumefaciens]NSZ60079.1 ABC transporter ATP-binding protein [Agrobacterium tumefaciens]QDY97679.1 ABC transporter ATP-binding protein [Agrobacterium tumefaciens]UXS12802.1 ABC transporter ATP-binding protein [Agrobacterium tumefaciens]UXS20163.1 ABC transporter ATP-binding protein [Agrobacterium tumefaciens]UXS27811.1 ABC transporter ATP-binding protein [Agrobacterium tumefaciens]
MPDLLNVKNIQSGYGRIPILFGIDLSIAEGEFVGILGHNGMGKSTLLRTLMGHIPATAGTITFAGTDVTRASPAARSRSGIGYVPQGRQIFPALSVIDNLRVAASRAGRKQTAIIEQVIEEFPRLKPILSRAGGVLSGGEQQIVALARCLCAEPQLVLLDEPTEGIQPSIIEEMKDTLKALARSRNLSILLVEQNLEFISDLATRVLVIKRGQLSGEIDSAKLHDADLAGDILPA